MKTLRLLLLFLVATSTPLLAEPARWLTDYEKAAEQAKKENKNILLDFTGSDWCGWCMKLDKEVFKTKEFKEYAAKNLVLVEVDFPQAKSQTLKIKKQNESLKQQYDIKGYPTLVILDKDGKELGRAGYTPGGPSALIAKLDALKKP